MWYLPAYLRSFRPMMMNSNTVFKFSGDGAVTNIFAYLWWQIWYLQNVIEINIIYIYIYIYIFLSSYPYEIAPARHSPIAADLPLPLPAVSETVERSVCSEMASRKDNTAFAWSEVFVFWIKAPICGVSSKFCFISSSSGSYELYWCAEWR